MKSGLIIQNVDIWKQWSVILSWVGEVYEVLSVRTMGGKKKLLDMNPHGEFGSTKDICEESWGWELEIEIQALPFHGVEKTRQIRRSMEWGEKNGF